MKLEIWSDIMCPFCYIGKRRLENALAQFPHRDALHIVWRSFELDPNMQTKPGQSIHELLAERKGVSLAQGQQMNAHMGQIAQEVGLRFDFDNMVPVNTFLAHRFLHLAATHGQQDAAKEHVLAAYFTEGRNVDDIDTLVEIGAALGFDAAEVRAVLHTDAYTQEVRHDEYQARQIGVRGVPYFVFDDKYAVSGAQPSELFLEVLEKVWEEAHPAPAPVVLATGDACGLDGSDC
ncbi:DsbA family oxidoreductase [Hymenobacter elongatus]|uniref:DsbA family oxidoreductase n=1 Tax=Hymenobacter elongatus TaxID=877208 RepID=A0A4Z0PNH8_9BACT|nr:DsbA family oxidoreductase [Hymenobacter elongatus]TGE17794.1 DsbA family oxidoreductase [Hymenobacter elongatus]